MTLKGMQGGCDCGAVRIRLDAEPVVVNCCHCRDCQQQTGTAFAVNVIIERDNLAVLSGEPVGHDHSTGSGAGQTNFRCPVCGTSVWSTYHAAGDGLRFVRGGALDEPGAASPDVHIFTAHKLPWVALPEGVPSYEGFYPGRDIPAIMGAENAARFGKAVGRG
jgi:hypothetical protein